MIRFLFRYADASDSRPHEVEPIDRLVGATGLRDRRGGMERKKRPRTLSGRSLSTGPRRSLRWWMSLMLVWPPACSTPGRRRSCRRRVHGSRSVSWARKRVGLRGCPVCDSRPREETKRCPLSSPAGCRWADGGRHEPDLRRPGRRRRARQGRRGSQLSSR